MCNIHFTFAAKSILCILITKYDLSIMGILSISIFI